MKIWLLNPYGPIPGESWRDYSFTMMADALTKGGHEVVWWTSNFSHQFKRFRSNACEDLQVSDRFIVRLVPTPGYRRNVGFGRIVRDIVFAYRAYTRGKKSPPPDCVIYYESPLTFGYAGQKLARHHGCPVIFDQMDLWPELIEKVFPRSLQPAAHLVLSPIYRNRRRVYSRLDAVIGLANAYLEVPLREAPILRSRPNAVIYNGIDVLEFRNSMKMSPLPEGILPRKEAREVWAVFAGSLGPSYDIATLLEVAELLEGSPSRLRIIIAGDGPFKGRVEAYVAEKKHARLYYAGRLLPDKLAALYNVCDIALCAYSNRSNVEMPDKIYDYTAAGLPVVNSLRGEVSDVIREKRIGLQYDAGNSRDLLETLEILANDDALRGEMARNSYDAGMLYDRHVQYAKLVEIVEKVCARKPVDATATR